MDQAQNNLNLNNKVNFKTALILPILYGIILFLWVKSDLGYWATSNYVRYSQFGECVGNFFLFGFNFVFLVVLVMVLFSKKLYPNLRSAIFSAFFASALFILFVFGRAYGYYQFYQSNQFLLLVLRDVMAGLPLFAYTYFLLKNSPSEKFKKHSILFIALSFIVYILFIIMVPLGCGV